MILGVAAVAMAAATSGMTNPLMATDVIHANQPRRGVWPPYVRDWYAEAKESDLTPRRPKPMKDRILTDTLKVATQTRRSGTVSVEKVAFGEQRILVKRSWPLGWAVATTSTAKQGGSFQV
jgi:hypothetical protein